MIRGAVAFHGLRIAWTIDGSERDPVRRLLAAYPEDTTPRAPAVAFHVTPAADVDASGFRTIVARDGFASLERAGAILLRDGDATVLVSSDGRRIDVANPAGASDEHGFVESTLLIALAVALGHHDLHYLHAGALVRGDGTRVLVAGDSGAGKSTVTLALLDATASVLGDDTVFFAERDGQPRVLAFARPFHLGAETHAAHPSLLAGPVGRRGKRAVPLAALATPLAAEMDPPQLVLFPEIAHDGATAAFAVGAADAFGLALQASAAAAQAEATAQVTRQLDLLRRLFAGARAFRLRLGPDCRADPGRIAAVVGALS